MKKLLLLVVVVLWLTPFLSAENLYLTFAGAGTRSGATCANGFSTADFNDITKWGGGAGKISGGDTVHACTGETFSTQLSFQASGTAGNIITFEFDAGATLAKTSGTMMSIFGKSYVHINCNSVANSFNTTDNGSPGHYGSQVLTYQLKADGGIHDVEIDHCSFQNAYVHDVPSDHSAGADSVAINASGSGNNVLLHHNTYNNCNYCVYIVGEGGGASGLRIYNSTWTNYNQGIRSLMASTGGGASDVEIHDNDFGSTVIWDTPPLTCGVVVSTCYHHNAIHIFGPVGSLLNNVKVYNNYVHGDWGDAATSMLLYGECDTSNGNSCSDLLVFNNVVIAEKFITNGLALGGGSGWKWFNNTFIGGGFADQVCVGPRRLDQVFINNVISGCKAFVNGVSGNTFSTTGGPSGTAGLDYNIYANHATGGSASMFTYNGAAEATFFAWQGATAQEVHSTEIASAGLSATGQPLAGSTAIGFGQNLSAYAITALNSDITGAARPAMGMWDAGAYVYNAAPAITSLSISTGVEGAVVSTTITGTGFDTSCVVTVSGTGVTVFGTVCTDATHIAVDFIIGAAATVSARNVAVTTTAGTSNNSTFTVTCLPTTLSFTDQPADATLGLTLGATAVSVACGDGSIGSTASVTLAKGAGATWGTLNSASSLTKSAVAGVATWTDLFVTVTPGSGFITATSSGAASANSNSITIGAGTSFTGKPRIRARIR